MNNNSVSSAKIRKGTHINNKTKDDYAIRLQRGQNDKMTRFTYFSPC